MSRQDIGYLVGLIQAFADRGSNPVIEVLAGQAPVANMKYPQEELHFQEDNWRGFYHCHDAPGKIPSEHGHFHLFARLEQAAAPQWAHVAALAMDYDGQPISWFMVNHWVTSGTWIEASALKPCLYNIKAMYAPSLLEQWLLAMMYTYREQISKLLDDRDRALIQINETSPRDDILQCKDVYVLSSYPVNLQDDLLALA